ncbi:hypothetical protein SISNIDRAFT_220335 [Sistotremastrum niveocremeum HHB9708]|uniref:Uncharacterized protein n=1 Tax=Sistotremastrum niveocremeum HHB9708 TaxID=1314777 RepID=A0A164QJP5_9AGAM|nr:hypothetical protein SISNIDRAFT_220335 [Sistotremastrum niveocremeum HHB9708]
MAGPHRAPFPVRMFRCIHRLEETIGISCGLYGILLTLFIITLHVFLFERRSRGSFAIILSMLLLTMSIATVTFGLTIIHEVGQFHPKTLSDCQGSAITSSFIALVPIQLIFVDIFAIYRTWLLYERKFFVILFPFLCDTIMLAFLLMAVPKSKKAPGRCSPSVVRFAAVLRP